MFMLCPIGSGVYKLTIVITDFRSFFLSSLFLSTSIAFDPLQGNYQGEFFCFSSYFGVLLFAIHSCVFCGFKQILCGLKLFLFAFLCCHCSHCFRAAASDCIPVMPWMDVKLLPIEETSTVIISHHSLSLACSGEGISLVEEPAVKIIF